MRFSQKKGQINCNYLNQARKNLARKNKVFNNARKTQFNESKYYNYTSKRSFTHKWKAYFPKATIDRKWSQMKRNAGKKDFTPSTLQEKVETLASLFS